MIDESKKIAQKINLESKVKLEKNINYKKKEIENKTNIKWNLKIVDILKKCWITIQKFKICLIYKKLNKDSNIKLKTNQKIEF